MQWKERYVGGGGSGVEQGAKKIKTERLFYVPPSNGQSCWTIDSNKTGDTLKTNGVLE